MNKNSSTAGVYSAPAVERAFRLLDAVAVASQPPRLSELARDLGFSKSTTHGLVHALIATGALDQDPDSKRLSLGPAVVELAFKNRNYLFLGEKTRPVLEDLRYRIDETVFFGVMHRARTLIMASAEAHKSMKISASPGTSIPLLAGAVGKVFLSQMDEAGARQTVRNLSLPKFTAASIIDEERYLAEVEQVRQTGVAVDRGEYLSGVNAVAVGLGRRRGVPTAMWVVGFAESMGAEKIGRVAEETLKAASVLRERIGADPPEFGT
ncbi:MAG: IclR family transcriptional regulator [Desulfobacterales bacterium]|nr:IclR family transcriptional regulator [Desulfobacterales bacterium]MCF8078141.1 IclR family transcriptional regulator [Desulfobacterales bacterium]